DWSLEAPFEANGDDATIHAGLDLQTDALNQAPQYPQS
ncbi:unnamed protein product, partial [Didymodactylos carnosus]